MTHRTDDNSKLPALLPAETPKKKEDTKDAARRPKLRLLNAPAPTEPVPEAEAAMPEENEWEEIPSVKILSPGFQKPFPSPDSSGFRSRNLVQAICL